MHNHSAQPRLRDARGAQFQKARSGPGGAAEAGPLCFSRLDNRAGVDFCRPTADRVQGAGRVCRLVRNVPAAAPMAQVSGPWGVSVRGHGGGSRQGNAGPAAQGLAGHIWAGAGYGAGGRQVG